MDKNLQRIIDNIKLIKQIIAEKTDRDINIVLATKTVDKEVLLELAQYNSFILGENRVQELLSKYFFHPNITWHFIGQLQSNKVKYIIDKVDLIHSVDRMSLAEEINKQAERIDRIMDILIEVNVAGEQNKGGVPVTNTSLFIKEIAKLQNIRVKGIMAVMPNVIHDELNNYYLQLKTLYDTIKQDKPQYTEYFSVGMSGDYLTAIDYGSNMVRLGSAIFGERRGG